MYWAWVQLLHCIKSSVLVFVCAYMLSTLIDTIAKKLQTIIPSNCFSSHVFRFQFFFVLLLIHKYTLNHWLHKFISKICSLQKLPRFVHLFRCLNCIHFRIYTNYIGPILKLSSFFDRNVPRAKIYNDQQFKLSYISTNMEVLCRI